MQTKINANLAIRFVKITNEIKIIKGCQLEKQLENDCTNCIFIENQISYQANNGINGLINLINCLDQNQKQKLLITRIKTYFNQSLLKEHRDYLTKDLINKSKQGTTINPIVTKGFKIGTTQSQTLVTITYQLHIKNNNMEVQCNHFYADIFRYN